MTDGNASPASKNVSPRGAKWIFWLISISGFMLIAGFLLVRPIFESRRSLPQLKLADGRILQIEGVTYGTKHRIGTPAFLVEFLVEIIAAQ